jgi:Domain of unknown function (DUF5916)/Carbohydrate family 9 binding domain-like
LVRWLIVIGVVIGARVAHADAPGIEALSRGIRSFEARQYHDAEKQFGNALSRGGLSRAQTLTAYVDLGVTLIALGKTNAAENAFEQAALIDPSFGLPPKSASRAQKLAKSAKHKQESVGPYHFEVSAPGEAKAGTPFHVTVEMSDEQAGLVALVHFFASEPGGTEFETVEPSGQRVGVDIPGDIALAGAVVTLRFDVLDTHSNRLATVEKQVRIGDKADAPTEPKEPVVKPKEPIEPPPTEPGKPKAPKKAEEEGSDDEAAEEGPWSIPHGSKKYTAVRADHAPVIDGLLDDPIWKTAPKDDHFLSTKSKPFGKTTPEPTEVQVAYDATNLYVAFHCRYSKPRERNDAYAGDEATLLTESENVTVLIDAEHAHSGAYQFAVSPAGSRADAELSDQGSVQNLDWHGIWDVATSFTADGWTAEFAIPWGTMYMPASDEAFDVGINFARHEPFSGETALWALHPPATELYDINFFGHLDGLARVAPDQRLLLLPYIAAAFDAQGTMQSQLTDLTGTGSQGRFYGGAYLRLRPPGPFRLDATFNPDFTAVNPDQALANFDRFELEYPEARTFFAEDAPRFAFGAQRYFFGDLGAQLFYSRRLGIITDAQGLTQLVPILFGVKSVLRAGGTEAAVMNVETAAPTKGIELQDNATVGRVTETIEGQRFGGIILARQGDSGGYTSGGGDAQLAFYDRHLLLSGFYAGSQIAGATSAAGEGTVGWKSQDVYAKATLLDIGKGFQAPLGFFPITGVRAETVAAGYTPVVRSDLVQQVFIDTQTSVVRDRDDDTLVYRRSVISAGIQTIDGAIISANVQPATENVTEAFPIGNGRIMVMPGTYKVLATQFDFTSPPNRELVFGIHYTGGDLFDGTRRAPGASFGLNLGRFLARATYQLYLMKFEDQNQSFYGHDVNLSASYAFTPLARSALVLEADTVAARGTAQFTTTYQFGLLSAITLAVRGQSGSTIDMAATNTFDHPQLTAVLSFAYGVSPL